MSLHKKPKPALGDDVRVILKKHGVDPLEKVLRLLEDAIEVTPDEVASPMIQRLLEQDYQIEPGEDGKLVLKPRLSLRLKHYGELCGFVFPKLRSAEVHSQIDQSLTVVIRKWSDDPADVLLHDPPRREIALPADNTGEVGVRVNES